MPHSFDVPADLLLLTSTASAEAAGSGLRPERTPKRIAAVGAATRATAEKAGMHVDVTGDGTGRRAYHGRTHGGVTQSILAHELGVLRGRLVPLFAAAIGDHVHADAALDEARFRAQAAAEVRAARPARHARIQG